MNKLQNIISIKNITDTVSPTFCLAKWHQPSIMLQLGNTTSCCHVAPHLVPIEEILEDPSALHNDKQSKQQRLSLHRGQQISSCNYCWNIEKIDNDILSARKEKNGDIFTQERFTQIKDNPQSNIDPLFVEVSFSNECNFKCGYCHPKFSTTYFKEIKEFGPYPTKHHGFDIKDLQLYSEDSNPYVQAWWKWWPNLSKNLRTLRVTGGEPLLQLNTWKLFEELEKNHTPHLELDINSNLGIKPILVDRMVSKINHLWEIRAIRFFKLFTSIDTWGPQAEYIRSGLNLETWENNFHKYVSGTFFSIKLMITFNILSVTTFKSLLEKILEWRTMYHRYPFKIEHRIRFDISYLVEPLQYSITLLPKEQFLPYMYDCLDFIGNNADDRADNKFTKFEFEKFNQIVKYMENSNLSQDQLIIGRQDFAKWFREYDKRRGTNFKKTFPEYCDIYEQWSKL